MPDSIPPEIFDCRRCGDCCLGEGGIILDERDVARLAAHLNQAVADFLMRCTELCSGRTRVRTAPDGYCLFYDHAIHGCAVHPARPDICRAWPFFRGNLVDEFSWRLAQDACPGIVAAAGHAAFARAGREYLRRHNLVRRDDAAAPCALTPIDRDDAAE